MSVEEYDVLVIGGGTGGLVSATRCAGHGLKTALVERYSFGDSDRALTMQCRGVFEEAAMRTSQSHRPRRSGSRWRNTPWRRAQLRSRSPQRSEAMILQHVVSAISKQMVVGCQLSQDLRHHDARGADHAGDVLVG